MIDTKDMGAQPWVVDIEKLTTENDKFRVAKWTGTHLQMTVMSIKPGEEVGMEVHNDIDQFLRIDQGKARVLMGDSKEDLEEMSAEDDWAIFVPAGKWHNILNDGDEDLRMYSIYAKPEHEHGTIHETYEEAMEAEHDHEH